MEIITTLDELLSLVKSQNTEFIISVEVEYDDEE